MINNKVFWLTVMAVAVVFAGIVWLSKGGDTQATTQATYPVAQGPLTISITVSGTIKAREMTIIKNEVEGQTSIISLIPEGTRVQKGDLLVELDASSLIDNRLDQEIRQQNAEAAYIGATENLAVVKNQAKSDIDLATLTLQFAREDLQKYIDGEYPNELKKAESEIKLAQEVLTRSQETLKWSRTLFEEKYLSETEMKADELLETKNTLNLELAQNNMNLLREFTYKRKLAQFESDVRQAEMALERVTRKASADVVQAEANLKAKQLEDTRQRDKLQKFEEQIKKAKIYAPSEGLVIYATSARTGGRYFDVTPLIEGRSVREREELIYLPTTSSVKADVSIHESNLKKVEVGLPVIVTIDAIPGRKFLGTVAKISPLPDAQSMWMNPDLKVYNTEIFLDDNDETLRTGQSCQAEIIVAQYADCLYVPVQSVILVGQQPTVFVVKDGVTEERPVELGLDNNRVVRIVGGLAKGEEVLLAPPLKAGTVEQGTSAVREAIEQRVSDRLDSADPKSETPVPTEPAAMTPEQPEPMRQRRGQGGAAGAGGPPQAPAETAP